jgi:hypothetical protein
MVPILMELEDYIIRNTDRGADNYVCHELSTSSRAFQLTLPLDDQIL